MLPDLPTTARIKQQNLRGGKEARFSADPDPTDRSKGHALKSMFDHVVRTGQIDRLDAVVIIDADPWPTPICSRD